MNNRLTTTLARGFRSAVSARDAETARRAVRRQAPSGLEDAWNFSQTFRVGEVALRPFQVKSEFLGLLQMARERRISRFVEIGTFNGGTLFLFARAAEPDARLLSVDMPGGTFGGGYRRTHTRFIKSLARPAQRLELVRGDSHDPATVSKVHALMDGRADLLFIDGDHSLEGVRQDFESYRDIVTDGLIAFHDIVPGESDAVGGVPAFWAEVKTAFPHTELVEDWAQGGYGIGVLSISPGA